MENFSDPLVLQDLPQWAEVFQVNGIDEEGGVIGPDLHQTEVSAIGKVHVIKFEVYSYFGLLPEQLAGFLQCGRILNVSHA